MTRSVSAIAAAATIFEAVKIFVLIGVGVFVGNNFLFAPLLVPGIVIYVLLSLLVKNLWASCESQ